MLFAFFRALAWCTDAEYAFEVRGGAIFNSTKAGCLRRRWANAIGELTMPTADQDHRPVNIWAGASNKVLS